MDSAEYKAEDNKTGARARCPMCARPSDDHYRPFCSKRCANIDLSRWLSGGYVIPGDMDDSEDDPGIARRLDEDDQS